MDLLGLISRPQPSGERHELLLERSIGIGVLPITAIGFNRCLKDAAITKMDCHPGRAQFRQLCCHAFIFADADFPGEGDDRIIAAGFFGETENTG